jgi:signal transduction histidine kinase
VAQQGRILVVEPQLERPLRGGAVDPRAARSGSDATDSGRSLRDVAWSIEPDPARACLLLANTRFDLVLLDLEVSQESLEQVASSAADQQTPVFCIAGDDEGARPDASMRAMRVGARDLLPRAWRTLDGIDGRLETGLTLAREARQRHQLRALSDDDYARLRARYDDLKQHYGEQIRCFEDSQESFYLDLSRMMTIIGNIMDGIVFVDCDGYVSLMNAVAEDLLATKSFMAIGRPLSDTPADGELADVLREHLELAKDRPEIVRTVEVHHATSQDLLYIKVRTTRVADYRGDFAGTLTTLQDVTAEHKSDQLKNQYLSIVAHELRTPLTGIKTFSTMMSKGTLGDLNDKQQRVVESIREQSLRLEHQIDKLINLGHLESNEYGQDLETVDFGELVAHAVAPFEQPAQDRSITFEVDIPLADGELPVRGDRADLRRAVQVLVENAVKFARDGGRVAVSVTRTTSETNAPAVLVSIADDGVGIEQRYHRRIFEKFFQVEDPLTRHHGGAGLGLFFARSIVEAHGSRIDVQSELGKGANFTFSLPLCVLEDSPQAASMPTNNSGPGAESTTGATSSRVDSTTTDSATRN